MRFYFMENVAVHIISHSLLVIVSGDLPFEKSPMQCGGTFWQSFWSLLKMILNLRVSTWMDKPLSLMIFLEIRPEKPHKVQRYIYFKGNSRLTFLYILQDDYLISSEATSGNTLIGQAEKAKWWGQIYSNRLLLIPLGIWDKLPQILQKSGNSRGSLWPWCSFDWLWQTGSSKMSSLLPVFRNVLAGCGRESRVLCISLPTWYGNGNEIQLIRTKPCLETKIAGRAWLCFDQPMVDDERMITSLWPAKSEWSHPCNNELSQMQSVCIVPLMTMSMQ